MTGREAASPAGQPLSRRDAAQLPSAPWTGSEFRRQVAALRCGCGRRATHLALLHLALPERCLHMRAVVCDDCAAKVAALAKESIELALDVVELPGEMEEPHRPVVASEPARGLTSDQGQVLGLPRCVTSAMGPL